MEINGFVGGFVLLGYNPGYPGLSSVMMGVNAYIRSHSVIYDGSVIGDNFRTGHGVLIRENCTIGDNVSVGSHSELAHHVVIGDNVSIHSNCFISEYSEIGDEVWIGPGVCLLNSKHPRTGEALEPAMINQGAIIGANATIMPGVVVGADALVGAGALVTHNVYGGAVVVGLPARAIGDREDYGYES